jgi:hypothetical protein
MKVEELLKLLAEQDKNSTVLVCTGTEYFEIQPIIYTTKNKYTAEKAVILDVMVD